MRKPALRRPEDSTIYELHVRDFSISDETVPAAHRGTFLAFTDRHSDGMRHLRDLAQAGLNSLHLLPSNDIATIEEDRSKQQEPACDLRSLPPDSTGAAGLRPAGRGRRRLQLGLRPAPLHDAGGLIRHRSRTAPRARASSGEMVQGVNHAGLRVIMDVVYNHTPAAGQDPKSILDRIVPGYYQRLDPASGAVETSTCCANTATEHTMMGKLLVDSVRHVGARRTRWTGSAST